MDEKRKRTSCGRNQAVQQNAAEVMKRATIQFDGGGHQERDAKHA
jgi:hypothetical protein